MKYTIFLRDEYIKIARVNSISIRLIHHYINGNITFELFHYQHNRLLKIISNLFDQIFLIKKAS